MSLESSEVLRASIVIDAQKDRDAWGHVKMPAHIVIVSEFSIVPNRWRELCNTLSQAISDIKPFEVKLAEADDLVVPAREKRIRYLSRGAFIALHMQAMRAVRNVAEPGSLEAGSLDGYTPLLEIPTQPYSRLQPESITVNELTIATQQIEQRSSGKHNVWSHDGIVKLGQAARYEEEQ